MKSFLGYMNYGCLSAEKRIIWTAEVPAETAITSEEVEISIPDGWKLYKTISDTLAVVSPWGWNYLLNEILKGNESPYFDVIDKYGKQQRFELLYVKKERLLSTSR